MLLHKNDSCDAGYTSAVSVGQINNCCNCSMGLSSLSSSEKSDSARCVVINEVSNSLRRCLFRIKPSTILVLSRPIVICFPKLINAEYAA